MIFALIEPFVYGGVIFVLLPMVMDAVLFASNSIVEWIRSI